MFFTHEAIVNWWYDRINIYDQCIEVVPEDDLHGLQSCDLGSISRASDIVSSIFALSGIASVVSGSTLIIRAIERVWIKSSTKKKGRQRRPRQPL